jgi:plasmid stabilization system protein ParE
MRVEFIDSAKIDLHELRYYLKTCKPKGTWQIVKEQLQKPLFYLSEFPDSGSIPPELAEYEEGYRQILTNQQRLIYRVRGDTLYVHIICGQMQDLQEVLSMRLVRP